ncbi:hypothetical protein FOZ63_025054, partial [Perkinsus olseni]
QRQLHRPQSAPNDAVPGQAVRRRHCRSPSSGRLPSGRPSADGRLLGLRLCRTDDCDGHYRGAAQFDGQLFSRPADDSHPGAFPLPSGLRPHDQRHHFEPLHHALRHRQLVESHSLRCWLPCVYSEYPRGRGLADHTTAEERD